MKEVHTHTHKRYTSTANSVKDVHAVTVVTYSIVNYNRWAGHAAHMGERKGVYKTLVGKPEGTRPLGRPRRRWEDYIKMDL